MSKKDQTIDLSTSFNWELSNQTQSVFKSGLEADELFQSKSPSQQASRQDLNHISLNFQVQMTFADQLQTPTFFIKPQNSLKSQLNQSS